MRSSLNKKGKIHFDVLQSAEALDSNRKKRRQIQIFKKFWIFFKIESRGISDRSCCSIDPFHSLPSSCPFHRVFKFFCDGAAPAANSISAQFLRNVASVQNFHPILWHFFEGLAEQIELRKSWIWSKRTWDSIIGGKVTTLLVAFWMNGRANFG